MMKIAFIVPSRANMGPIVFTNNLITGLMQQGCICELFYFKDSLGIDFPVRCTKLHFFESIDFSDFDVVHTTGAMPDLYAVFHYARIKSKIVTGIHNFIEEDLRQLYSPLKSYIYLKLWSWALRHIENFVFSSKPMEDYYKNKIGLPKCRYSEIIPYGIPQQQLHSVDVQTEELLRELKSKYIVLVGCGVLIKRKGFSRLIAYLSVNKDAALVLIGDGPLREQLIEQALKNGVGDRLVMLGFRDNSINYYKYCDIYCLCSNSEGFGLAMLEAMSLGLPIVCSNLEIYEGYFTNREVALFEVDNQESLNNNIDSVIKNLGEYSKSSKKLFSEKFSLESMALRHIEFYKAILS